MSWLFVLPLTLLAVAILLAPGAGVGWAVGLRGPVVLLLAPAISISIIAVVAVLFARVGIPWSLLSFAAASVALMLVAVVLRRLVERRTGPLRLSLARFDLRSFGISLALWTALIGYQLVRLFRNPSSIIQSFDNVFHLNVVRYILDTGQASSLTVGALTAGGGPAAFYPAGWHAYASLVLGGARLVVPNTAIGSAVNAATLAVLVCAWAAGCLLLTQALAGGRLGVSLLITATLGSLYAFPWVFLPEGGLYPNLLGNSLLVAAVAWLYLLADIGRAPSADRTGLVSSAPWGVGLCGLALLLPGITLAHPSSTFMLAAFALAIAWSRWTGWGCSPKVSRRSRPALAVLIAASVAFGLSWVFMAPSRPTAAREPTGLARTFWELLQGAVSDGGRAAPTLSLLVLVGIVVAVRRHALAGLLIAGFAAVVYLLALGGPTAALSRLAGGLLYNDSERIAAFAVLAALPLLIGALDALDRGLERLAVRLAPASARVVGTAAVVGLALVIAVPLQLWSLSPMVSQSSGKLVVLGERTRRMSRDEYQLIVRMRELVPPGEKVIADPTTGGGFIYALSGVPLVFPHAFLNDSPAMRQLRSQMFNREQLAATCAAMDALGAHYFYYPGRFIYHATEGPDAFPGLDEPDLSMLKRVASDGKATLYRFTACR